MAKEVKKPVNTGKRPKREANSRNSAGAGFRVEFTPHELEEIRVKRRAMRERLYAAG